ncbi:MAG: hypothetical protein HQK49_19705 [Oligoflexia bacterium]|nr:hypothetical protein [Oligoflexia bacterium]
MKSLLKIVKTISTVYVVIFIMTISQVYGAVLRVPLRILPEKVDPQKILDISTATVSGQIFETLYDFSSEHTLRPVLATSHSITNNGKTIDIRIREDKRFSDGTTLHAYHVVNMLNRVAQVLKKEIAWAMGDIEGFDDFISGKDKTIRGVSLINKSSIRIKFAKPFSHFLQTLSSSYFAVGLEKNGKWIGTGDYHIDTISADKKILILKSIKKLPTDAPSEINFIKSEGPEKDIQLLNEQKIDLLSTDDLKVVSSSQFKQIKQDYLQAIIMVINHKNHNFLNSENRCNLVRSLRASAVDAGHNWGTMDLRLPFSKNLFATNDVAKKQQKNTLKIAIVSSESAGLFWNSFNDKMLHNLLGYGYDAKIESHPISTLIKKIKNNDFNVAIYGYLLDYPSPDALFYPLLFSNQQYNFSGFSNKDIDQLLIKSRSVSNKSEQSRYYQQLMQILSKDCSIAFLGGQKINIYISRKWTMPKASALGFHRVKLSELRSTK